MLKKPLAVVGLLVVTGFGAISFAQRLTLVASAPIEMVDRAVADPQQYKVIGAIAKGEEVPVLGCVDLKHYIAPKVMLPSGTTGFVLVGQFELKRHSPWSLSAPQNAPMVFSC